MCILNKKNSKDNVYECHKIYALVTNARAKHKNVLDFIFGFDSCLFFFHESDRKAGANKTKCTTVFDVFKTIHQKPTKTQGFFYTHKSAQMITFVWMFNDILKLSI